jgi:signal transduction histidine kinase
VSAVDILLRPVRLATWRELAYLLLGLAMSVVVFAVLVTLLTLGVSLLITLIGIPILLATAYVNRSFADLERRRAGFVLGERVPRRYRDASGGGLLASRTRRHDRSPDVEGPGLAPAAHGGRLRVRGRRCDPLGYCTRSALGARVVVDPAEGTALDIGDDWSVDSWRRALLAAAGGLAAAVLTAWICAALARGQALLARVLLAPGLVERVEELERTRTGAIVAQQDELERIERDLHDGAQARLVALAMDLDLAREKLQGDPEAAAGHLESAHEEAKTALVELRELVRGVHPVVLTDRGLDAALTALAARSVVPVSLDVHPGGRLARELEAAAYFVVAESLANVGKHSEAEHAWVRVARRGELLEVEVRDDGHGGAAASRGGLDGLARRVEALDGTFAVESPPEGGTIVRAELPCGS